MKFDWWEKLIIAGIVAICAAVLFLIWDGYRSCEESGGVYVRTLTGRECMKR